MTGTIRNIVLSVLLLTTTSGCMFQATQSKIILAENLLQIGELTETGKVAAEILKHTDLSPKERAKTDSILEICNRIKIDFTLSGSDVVRVLSKYNPKADNKELLRLEKESPLYKEFTTERAPQIIFNKNIKSLTKSILENETNPLLQVRKIYRWINDSVTWASALEYSIMPDIPGFVMKQRHGDCGMQTLLFMDVTYQ